MTRRDTRINPGDVHVFHAAAKLIEHDGDEGYFTCAQRYGYTVAASLLVAHLRRAFGAGQTYPTSPDVEEKVNAELLRLGKMAAEPGVPDRVLFREEFEGVRDGGGRG
jgi:hypothetical protein